MLGFPALKQRFATINPAVRLAFLASAAERIMPIYEKFWLGDFHPELTRSKELAWMSLEGRALDAGEVMRCLEVTKELADIYAEESIATLTQAANIGSYIMDVLAQTEASEVALAGPRCYSAVLTASDAVDGVLSRNAMSAASARAEEEVWLDAAVLRAESWNQPAFRGMFHDLGSFPPRWWAVYSTVARPY